MEFLRELSDRDIGFSEAGGPREDWKIRHAVRAILLDSEGSIAVLHVTKEGYHKLPGGGVEEGEDLPQALTRELTEETGCRARITRPLGTIREYRAAFSQIQISTCSVAQVEGAKGTPQFTEVEAKDGFSLLWMSPHEAAVQLAKDTPTSYVGCFIRARDLEFLNRFLAL